MVRAVLSKVFYYIESLSRDSWVALGIDGRLQSHRSYLAYERLGIEAIRGSSADCGCCK